MKHTKPHLDPTETPKTQHSLFCIMHILILKKTGSFVRILFVDFSSAFNTIQLHLMASKRLKLDLNTRLILWIVDFLVNRSQTVVTKLHSRLPALFPLALHKALFYLLFFLHSMQMAPQALTQHQS